MLTFLFRGLTAPGASATRLFEAVTAEARQPGWYVESEVPDTLDGRFAMLATITALTMVRLEQLSEPATALSVALTERFIDVMEAEHRELGVGDPTLGKTVRKLVGSLARRTELWRSAIARGDWRDSVRQSLYRDQPTDAALDYSVAALKELWVRVAQSDLAALAEGKIG